MTSDTPTRRRFYPTPGWLILALLVMEGLLWLSERYRWFWFNDKKGWPEGAQDNRRGFGDS